MNVFNRIVVILLSLLLLIGAVLVLLFVLGVVPPQQIIPAGIANTPLGQWLAGFANLPANARLTTTAIAALVALLSLILLYFELRPAPRDDTIVIREDGLGRVTVRKDSVHDLVLHTASSMDDVLQVHPTIRRRDEGLDIRCRASLRPESSVQTVSEELQTRVKEAVQRHLGLQVANVEVQAQLQPLGDVEPRSTPRPARRQLR
jgi:hypothetical protein